MRGEIAHLVIDSTDLKVFGEGEWKVKKHGQEKRRVWRKLHLAVDTDREYGSVVSYNLFNRRIERKISARFFDFFKEYVELRTEIV
ncbi:Uncharacterised protein [Budvicia aquatica]|uniref:Transposase IS4-like domain-containing protein n=1 Tax=Budvicia aquatica TaxID=82979 RepID=A0A484ZZ05_9GAMM|nr:Uncharacterised protein [Budvicia aquatica]